MNKWVKTGVAGFVITAICCFTPALVWLLTAIGLTVLLGYLDVFLLPLLGLFIVMIMFGVSKSAAEI